MTFTPTDTTDYNTVAGSVSVTVNTAAPTVTVTPGSSSIAVTSPLSVTVTVSGGAGTATSDGLGDAERRRLYFPRDKLYERKRADHNSGQLTDSGSDTLTGSYTPDANECASYKAPTEPGRSR